MDIGEKLKTARLAKGMTQDELAQEIMVSRQTISGWENGKTYPDIISLIKFSDLLGVSLDSLVKGDRDMIQHLKESTDSVSADKNLIIAIVINILVVLLLLTIALFLPRTVFALTSVFCLAAASTGLLLWRIVRRI